MHASPLPKLYEHMHWADSRTMESLRAMSDPPAQALALFAHLLAAQHVWLSRIEGTPSTCEVFPTLSLEQCEQLAKANHAGLTRLAASDAATLARHVHYTNLAGHAFDTPLEDILLHVTHHSMYHRGQVALLVRAGGGAPLGTDYIAFTRRG